MRWGREAGKLGGMEAWRQGGREAWRQGSGEVGKRGNGLQSAFGSQHNATFVRLCENPSRAFVVNYYFYTVIMIFNFD